MFSVLFFLAVLFIVPVDYNKNSWHSQCSLIDNSDATVVRSQKKRKDMIL